MIDFIAEYKYWVIAAVVCLLLANNWGFVKFVGGILLSVLSIFKFIKLPKKDTAATKDERQDLYECLIKLQDHLAICGIDRKGMDEMTLAEIGVLTCSAETALNPPREGQSYPTTGTSHIPV